jgi:hypothetical protein
MSETTYVLTGEDEGVLAVSPAELDHLGLALGDIVTPADLLQRSRRLPVSEWWLGNLIAQLCAYDQPVIYVRLG